MRAILLLVLGLLSLPVFASVQTREIPYKTADGTQLIAYFAYDDSTQGPRPGIVVVHEWWGLNDYARSRARQLAALGYAALAIDMYGDAKTTESKEHAAHMMNAVAGDNKLSLARADAGLKLLKAQPEVDARKIAAIGYCFGGKIVLDMARQGLDVQGVASFHGVLATATPAQKGAVRASVLVMNGAADPFIPAADIDALKAEMQNADVDFSFVNYPGAKHAFSNPDADRLARANGLEGALAYNESADKASWQLTQDFFKRIFADAK